MLHKERLVKGLLEGQDCAFQLRHLLKNSLQDQSYSSSCDHLMLKIFTSFTDALSSLHTTASASASASASDNNNHSVEVCSQNNLASSLVIDSDRRSEDSGDSRKRPSATSTTANNRRASYKRKKTCGSLTNVSPTLDDGHAWRKYGQKDILNAKYPRSYFRCSHKHDQGCKAIKQVQRKEDDPDLYLITYFGNHTCSDFVKVVSPAYLELEYSNNYSSAPTIKEETTTVDIQTHSNNVIWKDDFMTFHDHTSTSLDSLVQTIGFATHDFQYLDESEFNYL